MAAAAGVVAAAPTTPLTTGPMVFAATTPFTSA
jgi:hypothetical protein